MKKFLKVFICLLMALTLVGATACGGGGGADGKTYTVTLNLNGGTLAAGDEITSYVSGEEVVLPTPTKDGETFAGWYKSSDFSGNRVVKIYSKEKGDREFWAKWSSSSSKPQTYAVTLHVNGGTLPSNLSAYTYGVGAELPTPTKSGSTFGGWFANQNCTGTAVTEITATDSGAKEYWAKWNTSSNPSTPTVQTYKVTLNLNGGTLTQNLTSYTKGTGATLPTPTKANSSFDGWFDNSGLSGTAVTKISANDTGDKEYWAKWTATATGNLTLSAYEGYAEGAFVEFPAESGVSNYTVSYKKSGASGYTDIDNELIRVNGSKVRADIVGLSKGSYSIQVVAGSKKAECYVTVTSYDRSGYAHFGYTSGVGAYKDDGTPKSGAQIIYVTEKTKNTVKATINGKSYTGIAAILGGTVNSKNPVIVRIIGQISAATWKEGNVTYTKSSSTTVKGDKTSNLKASVIKGKNGKQLPRGTTEKINIFQEDLIKDGYNELDTSKYSVLNGLNSKATWSPAPSGKSTDYEEYDSAWNNCVIGSSNGGAENVTVEGIGTDAEIFQWGLTWINCNSIEVRNLTFDDYTEDACSFEGKNDYTNATKFDSQRIWIHNCTINQGKNYWDVCPEQDKKEGDGGTDFKKCSYVTISYNHYYLNHKTGLIGGGDTQKTASVTFHHNYYQQCNSRLPLGRQANMHMYNNYYYGSTGTNMSLRSGAYALIEYCYFQNAKNPITTADGTDSDKTTVRRGVAKVYQCTFSGCSVDSQYDVTVVADRTKTVSNDNVFNKTFDTDANAFYYDATKKVTRVHSEFPMLATAEVPTKIPQLAGVLKK